MTVTEQTYGHRSHLPNAGFIRKLWLLREPDVLGVLEPRLNDSAPLTYTVGPADLLARVGSVVTGLEPPSRTATFDEAQLNDPAGTVYLPTLQLSLPRPPAQLDHYLTVHQAMRWVAFWLDYNGQGWVAGDAGNGLRLTIHRKQAEQTQLQLQLAGRSWHPTWRLATTDLATLFPNADFDYSFDLSFNS